MVIVLFQNLHFPMSYAEGGENGFIGPLEIVDDSLELILKQIGDGVRLNQSLVLGK